MTRHDPSKIDAAKDEGTRVLVEALGPEIMAALQNPSVVEILVNQDGVVWTEHLDAGRRVAEATLEPTVAQRIIRLVAMLAQIEVNPSLPILATNLPGAGERFVGVLPPVVRAPSFAIRKRMQQVMTMSQHVERELMTATQADFLRAAVHGRLNIVVAGGASSGKTALANALLDEMAKTRDRVLVLDEAGELQCRSDDHVALRLEPGESSMADVMRATSRFRPDRVVVGDVRGTEALDLLKAWGDRYPGGIATIHAGSAAGALRRLERLVQEAGFPAPGALVAQTVHVVVSVGGRGTARRVRDIVRVVGYDSRGYLLDAFRY